MEVRILGGEFSAAALSIRFCISSLLIRIINVQELKLIKGTADLRGFNPPESTSKGPFPGVFPSLDIGFGFALNNVNIDAVAQLSEHERAQVNVTGGGTAPGGVGALNFAGLYEISSTDSLAFDGTLEFDQLTRGLFNSIVLELRASATSASLPQPEHFSAVAIIKPTVNPPQREVESADGDTHLEPLPEELHLTLLQQDAKSKLRAGLEIDALYHGSNGAAAGTYTLNSSDSLVAPYVGDTPLPRIAQAASGNFDLDLVRLTGEILMDSRTAITELDSILGVHLRVPTQFMLLQDIAMSFTADRIVVKKLRTRIEDENSRTILNSSMPQAFAVDFADPAQALVHAKTLLTFEVGGILLAWFNSMLPQYEIVSGALKAKFDVNFDEEGHLVVAPRETVEVADIRIDSADSPLIENVKIRFTPRVYATAEQITVDIQDLLVTINDTVLASARLNLRAPTNAEGSTAIHINLAGEIHLDPILEQPPIQAQLSGRTLPNALSLQFESVLVQEQDNIRIDQFRVELSQLDKQALVEVKTEKVITIQMSDADPKIKGIDGDVATIALKDIDLAWLNPLAEPYALAGSLHKAKFTLQAVAEGKFILTPDAPVEIRRFRLGDASTSLLDNVWLSVRPKVEYGANALHVSYSGLRISGGKLPIISGRGAVTLKTGDEQPLVIDADGRLHVTLNNLALQPVVTTALATNHLDTPLSTHFSYRLTHSDAVTEIRSLDLELLHEKTPYIGIKSATGLTIKPKLNAGENLAQHAVGEITLSIDNLIPDVLAELLPSETATFDTINGVMHLSSDGERLSARTDEALVVSNVRITDGDGKAVLHPFDVTTSASLEATGQSLNVAVDELSVNFRNAVEPALSGKLTATVEPAHTIPLRRLEAEFAGMLPQLLNQPVVLPGHALTSGSLGTTIMVEPNGDITANTRLNQLASAEPLAIHTIEMPLSGNMRKDGQGFDFKMPLIGTGQSGISNARAVGEYIPKPDQPALLSMQVTSELFYLNDILATISGIKAQSAAQLNVDDDADSNANAAPAVVDEKPDDSAFWNILPYDTRIDFLFKQVFYSEYVVFNSIEGQIDIADETLTLNDFSAYFHESPITLDGGFTFNGDGSDPYTAKLAGKVIDFDLNQFFTELAPSKTSRIEGLFGVDVAIAGSSPNAAQFRNRLLLDINMTSRDGLFRALPPDGVLMAGASDALGIIGEGLSYIPTGGFGAGAISRLVNYIAEIEYDSFDIRIKRDTSLDLKIERFDMLSPNIRMAATGTIEHSAGKDIVDSPLDLVANLNMVGKGAAILYSLDLLDDQQDKFGYWMGPEFKVSGSVSATESNLAEIIQRAADSTVKGAVTRPISGLIGNVKYRWFGADAQVEAAKREIIETDAGHDTSDFTPDAVTH